MPKGKNKIVKLLVGLRKPKACCWSSCPINKPGVTVPLWILPCLMERRTWGCESARA